MVFEFDEGVDIVSVQNIFRCILVLQWVEGSGSV